MINNTTKFSIYYQESDEFKFIFPRFSPYSHPNNKWGHFYWSVRNVTWGFLISIFPAVKCKLPLRDLTFGQNKIIVIVHNSNDPRNCVVYSVILNRDSTLIETLPPRVTYPVTWRRTKAICERIRNCLLLECPGSWHAAVQCGAGMFAAPLPGSLPSVVTLTLWTITRHWPGLSTFSWQIHVSHHPSLVPAG